MLRRFMGTVYDGAVQDTATDVDLTSAAGGVGNGMQACAGDDFNCFLNEKGKVWCWGKNDQGQLGESPLLWAWAGKGLDGWGLLAAH